ncbi:methyltransferase [Apiospora hydei]|uniref:Methyltransferase n=1 Tax=Apiospora hydei TaxID=1337664 RepID=A0ABR1WYL7_9PEZI
MASHTTLPSAAAEGFKDAASYDAHRPSYPPEVVESFLEALKITGQPDMNIVEVASGTGKFTELLAGRPERFLIKAIEPHEGMRGRLAEKDLSAVEVVDGTADKMPVSNDWGDACIAAQAFHWFATPESLQEIHRVLRPGAVLGMIWNVEDYTKKWKDVFQQQLPGNPLQALADTLTNQLPRFSLPIGEKTSKWTVWLTEDALWSRLSTLSQIAVLKGEEKEAAVKVFKEAMQSDDVERNGDGEIALHGVTYFAWTDRI